MSSLGRQSETASEHRRDLLELLGSTLAYAREREYTGWDYCDGMSSRIRRALPFENRWVNLAFQETAKRAPVNVRPLLLVEQRRNYKGTALFAVANLTAARQVRAVDPVPAEMEGVDYRGEAHELADWLVTARREGYSGFCGGHNHEIQGLSGRGNVEDADAVSTSYAVRALLDAEALDARYPQIARSAIPFVLEDLDYRETPTGATVDYYQDHPDDSYTINAGALAARLLVDLYDRFGDEELCERATKILDHVAALQTDLGGWHYREPPSASHLSMDNHHNGFVVECFQRYHEVVGPRYEETLDRSLSFYRNVLFDPDGAPNWDENSAYPRDIHAVAQGILVFAYAGEFEFAERILDWSLENLYGGDGQFYYRKHRFFTRRYTLMRWCQAWMAYAVAELLAEQYPTDESLAEAEKLPEEATNGTGDAD